MIIPFEILHRLHWSKVRLNKIKHNFDSTCDQCRLETGSLIHMFWTCSRLEAFGRVFLILYPRHVALQPCPFIAILGVMSHNANLSKAQCGLIASCTLLAHRQILMEEFNPIHPQTGDKRCHVFCSTGEGEVYTKRLQSEVLQCMTFFLHLS